MINCDYCVNEDKCSARSSYINFAEAGCPGYRHADDAPITKKEFEQEKVETFIKDFI
jgi:hypothetical protein